MITRCAFDDGLAAGRMDAGRWEETIAYTALTHGLSTFAGARMHRPQLVAPALDCTRRNGVRRADAVD